MISFKGLFAVVAALIANSVAAQPNHLLKIATLAPEGSSWAKVLRTIDADVRQETDGNVGFKIYPGGVQGDEKVVLRKMRIGQLHGGNFGGQGVSQTLPDVLALQMPFLFNDYAEVDYVLEKMDAFYRQGYEERGYVFLGWADIGFVHILSQQPVATVEDMRAQKVWQLPDEPLTSVLFRLAGVTSVPLNIPDVLLGLQTNLIDVVYASPSATIVLQWFTRAKYVTQLPINYTLGALLIDKRTFAKILPADREHIHRIARQHMAALNQRNRRENDEAMTVLQANGLSLVEVNPNDVKTFKGLVTSAEAELVGQAFSHEAHEQIARHLQDFRRTSP
ncbi:MAG: TRAP transporter substrate-binding protein DctP [Gemmatimonadetes bacterium]|nr:TRAP transporter substrate-binding protein DctP [Gemmatimonadota bacterium]